MRKKFIVSGFAGLAVTGSLCFGQAVPTATRTLHLSAFGGVTGVYTGLQAGRNLGITAGLDLGFQRYRFLFPSLEVRGTLPIHKGQIDSQKNVLVGPKLALHHGRLQPYGDFLFGRGQINYGSGILNPARDTVYVQSVSNIYAAGGGVDVPLDQHLALKADAQFLRYSTPVTDSGHLVATNLTLGLAYSF